MAINDLLNRIRVGAPLNEGFVRPPIEELDRPPQLPDKRGVDFGCLPDQHWDTNLRRCVNNAPDEPVGGGGFRQRPIRGCTNPSATNYNPQATEDDGSCIEPSRLHRCPDGRTVRDPSECEKQIIDDERRPPREEPPFGCPPGQERDANGRCVTIGEDAPIGGDVDRLPSRYCKKLGRMIPSSQWTVAGCESGDPTPPLDRINEEVGGFRKQIGDEGGDIGDFYDRFPIDYDPSRFGDYYLPPTKEGIFSELGVDILDKYRKFFADYDIFPESLAGTEFDVGRKGLTADLFNLTRQSQRLRQQQGLLSGAPREFERLGMGQTGRQFQALDTAFRKDIFGKRKGFEEETIDRLLDLMKSGAEPVIDFQQYQLGAVEGTNYSDEFYSWLANRGVSVEQWKSYGSVPFGAGKTIQNKLFQQYSNQQEEDEDDADKDKVWCEKENKMVRNWDRKRCQVEE